VDISLNQTDIPHNIEIAESNLDDRISLDDNSLDIVTSMAIIEHLNHPEQYLKEVHRILKPNGTFVMTVPSVYAKPVLEFLAYKLGVISKEEILDHKRYYDRTKLREALMQAGFLEKNIHHSYFQLGMNNFVIATI
ncbi:MAG: methyltransferase domain-containing protein, partial [Candidatus Gracilibacteria bacterium]|nr:methyltransferase domain-containing protein [Candidatus Gracilibacteria bacterium]